MRKLHVEFIERGKRLATPSLRQEFLDAVREYRADIETKKVPPTNPEEHLKKILSHVPDLGHIRISNIGRKFNYDPELFLRANATEIYKIASIGRGISGTLLVTLKDHCNEMAPPTNAIHLSLKIKRAEGWMKARFMQKEKLAKEIVEGLWKANMICTWYSHKFHHQGWIRANGMWTPIYINLRRLSSVPYLYKKVSDAMTILVEEVGFEANGKHKLVGIAMTGMLLSSAVTLQTGIPSLYTRKLPENVNSADEVKAYIAQHGEHELVEGDIESGDILGLMDDVASTFHSKKLAIRQVRGEIERRGVEVEMKDIMVLFDWEQGAGQEAYKNGFRLHSVIPFITKGFGLLQPSLKPIEAQVIADYLRYPDFYQGMEQRQKIIEMARK